MFDFLDCNYIFSMQFLMCLNAMTIHCPTNVHITVPVWYYIILLLLLYISRDLENCSLQYYDIVWRQEREPTDLAGENLNQHCVCVV